MLLYKVKDLDALRTSWFSDQRTMLECTELARQARKGRTEVTTYDISDIDLIKAIKESPAIFSTWNILTGFKPVKKIRL